MAVVIRMKRMGRKNRAFYRICAADKRSPRDGRVIEAIGTYDTSISETDARCTFDADRLQHWLSKGAQPSDAVRVLIKKYGPQGTHLAQMEAARAKLSMPRIVPDPGPPAYVPEVKTEAPVEAPAGEAAVGAAAAEAAVEAAAGEAAGGAAAAETAVAEAPAEPAAEAPTEESSGS